MKKVNDNNKLAIQMLVAMVSGILVGLAFMAIRESVGADSTLWATINSILFQNISAAGVKALWDCSILAVSYSSVLCSWSLSLWCFPLWLWPFVKSMRPARWAVLPVRPLAGS